MKFKHGKRTVYVLAVNNKDNILEHHEVGEDIYRYVRQLENYINDPQKSQIISLYPERFKQ